MNIKEVIKSSRIKQWEIAEKLEIDEGNFSRMMRHPEKIKKEVVDKIVKAIEEIKSGC